MWKNIHSQERLQTIRNDHSIKKLVNAPPRLQRTLLHLQQYDVTVRYHSGKELYLVDALSHLTSPSSTTTLKMDVRIDHHGFIIPRLQQLKAETVKDPVLSIAY